MVALNETTSEPGLRRAARGGAAAATYPQGGTGIPAGEINYPGAAAQPPPSVSTGFRAVEGQVRLGRCATPLNPGAARTLRPERVQAGPQALAWPVVCTLWRGTRLLHQSPRLARVVAGWPARACGGA